MSEIRSTLKDPIAIAVGSSEEIQFIIDRDNEIKSTNAKLELQHYAILKYSAYLKKCCRIVPIVNSAFAKLSQYWQTSNNSLRISLLTVFERSNYILCKAGNTIEGLRLISLVLESNDPIARSLTLRLLGHLAQIASDRKELYHVIEATLFEPVKNVAEFKAAVFAADSFCQYSKMFAYDICEKIATSIKNSTHMDSFCQRQLVDIYSRMTFDPRISYRAFHLCLDLFNTMYKNAKEEYDPCQVLAILNTMKILCKDCRITRKLHVELLLVLVSSNFIDNEILSCGALRLLVALSEESRLVSADNLLRLFKVCGVSVYRLHFVLQLAKKLFSHPIFLSGVGGDKRADFITLITQHMLLADRNSVIAADILLLISPDHEKFANLLLNRIAELSDKEVKYTIKCYLKLVESVDQLAESALKLVLRLKERRGDWIGLLLYPRYFSTDRLEVVEELSRSVSEVCVENGVECAVKACYCLVANKIKGECVDRLLRFVERDDDAYWYKYQLAVKLFCGADFGAASGFFSEVVLQVCWPMVF